MPRVLITGYCAVPAPRRSGVQLRHVVRALAPIHNVDLLVLRAGDQAYVERAGTARILRVPTHDDVPAREQIQAFQRALRRQLEGADYDVVHCRDGWSAGPVMEAQDRLGYALVYDLSRSPLGELNGLDPELVAEHEHVEDACLDDADLVLAPTEPARRYAAARGRPERIALAPPGVDVDRFDWDEPRPGPPRLLYVGPLEPGRGVRVLLRALVEIVRHVDARLILAGPVAPGFDNIIHNAVTELGLRSRVELRPPVEHDAMPGLSAEATVCVAPSAAELGHRPTALYPTKILEYQACRRAVVAPRRGTVSMVIEHGRDGLLFAAGDPADLARKLLRLLEDGELRGRVAAAGYERVRRELTASGARRALLRAYADLAARPMWQTRLAAGARSEPEISVSTDDDDEATEFESRAATDESRAPTDGELSPLEIALASFDGDQRVVTEERPGLGDDTAEREVPRLIGRSRVGVDSGNFATLDGEIGEDWIISRPRRGDSEDDGTPIDVEPAPPAIELAAFVAGEIDVLTPPPEIVEAEGVFSAAGVLLGGRDADPGETAPETPVAPPRRPSAPDVQTRPPPPAPASRGSAPIVSSVPVPPGLAVPPEPPPIRPQGIDAGPGRRR